MLDTTSLDQDDLLAAERWRLLALTDRSSQCRRTDLCRDLVAIQQAGDTLLGAAEWVELHGPGYCPDCGRMTYAPTLCPRCYQQRRGRMPR